MTEWQACAGRWRAGAGVVFSCLPASHGLRGRETIYAGRHRLSTPAGCAAAPGDDRIVNRMEMQDSVAQWPRCCCCRPGERTEA